MSLPGAQLAAVLAPGRVSQAQRSLGVLPLGLRAFSQPRFGLALPNVMWYHPWPFSQTEPCQMNSLSPEVPASISYEYFIGGLFLKIKSNVFRFVFNSSVVFYYMVTFSIKFFLLKSFVESQCS